MATETDLFYLLVLVLFTLVLHVILSNKGPHRDNGNSK